MTPFITTLKTVKWSHFCSWYEQRRMRQRMDYKVILTPGSSQISSRWDTSATDPFCCFFPDQKQECLKRILMFSQRWPRHTNCKGQSCVDPIQTHNTIPQRTRSGKVHLFHSLSFWSRKVALKKTSLDGILQNRRVKIKQPSVGITDSFIIPGGKLVKCHCRLC